MVKCEYLTDSDYFDRMMLIRIVELTEKLECKNDPNKSRLMSVRENLKLMVLHYDSLKEQPPSIQH